MCRIFFAPLTVGLGDSDVYTFNVSVGLELKNDGKHGSCMHFGGINRLASVHIECITYAINIPDRINVNDGLFMVLN